MGCDGSGHNDGFPLVFSTGAGYGHKKINYWPTTFVLLLCSPDSDESYKGAGITLRSTLFKN